MLNNNMKSYKDSTKHWKTLKQEVSFVSREHLNYVKQRKRFNKTDYKNKVLVESEVWPSRGVHLCRVKQVHSVLISYGHQVFSHLKEHKNWNWGRETMGKFQLPRGHSWRAPFREDITEEGKDKLSASRCFKVCVFLKHFYNWKHWDVCSKVHKAVFH